MLIDRILNAAKALVPLALLVGYVGWQTANSNTIEPEVVALLLGASGFTYAVKNKEL